MSGGKRKEVYSRPFTGRLIDLTWTVCGRYYPHFTEAETEAYRGKVTGPPEAGTRFKTR